MAYTEKAEEVIGVRTSLGAEDVVGVVDGVPDIDDEDDGCYFEMNPSRELISSVS